MPARTVQRWELATFCGTQMLRDKNIATFWWRCCAVTGPRQSHSNSSFYCWGFLLCSATCVYCCLLKKQGTPRTLGPSCSNGNMKQLINTHVPFFVVFLLTRAGSADHGGFSAPMADPNNRLRAPEKLMRRRRFSPRCLLRNSPNEFFLMSCVLSSLPSLPASWHTFF